MSETPAPVIEEMAITAAAHLDAKGNVVHTVIAWPRRLEWKSRKTRVALRKLAKCIRETLREWEEIPSEQGRAGAMMSESSDGIE